jgi:hypothetical protein
MLRLDYQPKDITSTYVESAEVSDGVITIALQGTQVARLDAGSLILSHQRRIRT